MADYPAMPLWTDAYLADCGHLDDAEHGRYLLILMKMWRAPDCRLPNDDIWLAKQFRRSVDEIVENFRPLISEFCQTDGNWIFQKRLLKERKRVQKTCSRQSDAAKSRWEKEKGLSHGNAAPAMQPYPYTESIAKDAIDSSAVPAPEPEEVCREENLSEIIWGKCLDWLAEHTDKPKNKLRPIMGRWIKKVGEAETLTLLRAAARAGPVEPISWVQSRIGENENGSEETEQTASERSAERVAAVVARLSTRPGWQRPDGDDAFVLSSVQSRQ